jgi:protein-tyrosine phosphatase
VERRVPFEGAVNFRDLGGYPAHGGRRTKWRTIYRSDSLAELTERDFALWQSLDIRLICDFRMPAERLAAPTRLPPNDPSERLELPFLPDGVLGMFSALRRGTLDEAGIVAEVTRHYRLFAIDHLEPYRQVFTRLADPVARPAVFHCTSGKDRTGFGAAILLLAVGVPTETVFEDYLLTNDHRRDISHLLKLGIDETLMEVLTSARRDYLAAAIDAIHQRYDTVDRFLHDGLGLDEPRRSVLRDQLLEEPA